ncbi:concanavalin A-like lectin/glucanase domain-containing protein [Melanogaster broomeanus]|nr:concanavalin A-like lectin/glucanase domain-containing protein [Melanogaster broomeanus]
MFTRCFAMLCLALSLIGTLPCVYAAADTKVANRTIERTVQLRTHSIHPPYIDQDLQNRWWDFGGDATPTNTIRLTRSVPSQMGWLWSRLPLTSTNYVIEDRIQDGMAIWLTTDRAEPGPVFGSKDKFEGLGIFLDTYANSRHAYGFPRIVAMLGDGQTPYDQDNDGEGTRLAMVRRTNVITKLKITYVKDTYLDVKIHYRAWDDWTDCFRIDGISLPASPFLGISALTGQVYDAHDVVSVTTHSAVLSSADAPRDKLSSGLFGRRPDGRSSWLSFFVKLFLFVGACAGGAYGYKAYKLRSRYGGFMKGSPEAFRGSGIVGIVAGGGSK